MFNGVRKEMKEEKLQLQKWRQQRKRPTRTWKKCNPVRKKKRHAECNKKSQITVYNQEWLTIDCQGTNLPRITKPKRWLNWSWVLMSWDSNRLRDLDNGCIFVDHTFFVTFSSSYKWSLVRFTVDQCLLNSSLGSCFFSLIVWRLHLVSRCVFVSREEN